jgi:hypothetical protein
VPRLAGRKVPVNDMEEQEGELASGLCLKVTCYYTRLACKAGR